MDSSSFVDYLTAQPNYGGQAVHIERIPSRAANRADLDKPLPPALEDCLRAHGLWPLYTHQAEAVNLARQGGGRDGGHLQCQR